MPEGSAPRSLPVSDPLPLPLPIPPTFGLPSIPKGGVGKAVKELPIIGAAAETSEGLAGIAKFFKGFGELALTPEGWLRVAKLTGGAIFVLWGLKVIIRESTGATPSGAAQGAVGTATKATGAKAALEDGGKLAAAAALVK